MTSEFKHTLPTQTIVLRQDAGVDDKFLESNAGQLFPLIRIKDETIMFDNLSSFNLSVGSQFFPKVTFSFDDADYMFRETNFIEKNDIITIFVGNALDDEHEVIKNDYLVIDVQSTPGLNTISIEAILYVPKLFEGLNKVYNMTSIDIFRQLAKDVGLGFVTNVSSTEDSMKWIQSQTTLDFLSYVLLNSRINIDTKMLMFIDQFANLNCVDLKKSITASADTMLTIEPVTGEKLDAPVKLIATTYALTTEEIRVFISKWSPITRFGEESAIWPTTVETLCFDLNTNSTIVEKKPAQIHKQLRGNSRWSHFDTDNAYDSYASSKVINTMNNQLVQGIKLNINLDLFISVLYLYMTLPVEIWNIIKQTTAQRSQDPELTNEDIEKIEKNQPSNQYVKNERMSGDSLVQSMTISYVRSSTASSKRLVQSLQLFLKKQDV